MGSLYLTLHSGGLFMKRYIITAALALVFSTAAFTPPAQAQVIAVPLVTPLTAAQIAACQIAAITWWKSSASPSAAGVVAMHFPPLPSPAAQNWIIAQKDRINRHANYITALKTNHSFATTATATYGFPTLLAMNTAKTTILGILTGAPAPKRDNFAAALVANPKFTDSLAYQNNTAAYLAAYGFSSDSALKSARQGLLDILITVPPVETIIRME